MPCYSCQLSMKSYGSATERSLFKLSVGDSGWLGGIHITDHVERSASMAGFSLHDDFR